jgi:hypothetical protein
MKRFLLLVPMLVLTSCAIKYNGPGTFQDLANARYQCLQETSEEQSGSAASINKYGGAASSTSTVMPTCSHFQACLAAKGYYEDPNGKFDASGIKIKCRY